MLDHVTIGVSDLERAKAFYDAALRPLGIERLYAEGLTFTGYGAAGKAFFRIGAREEVTIGVHIAFMARDRETVGAFTRRRLPPAGATMDGPDCALDIIQITMAPLFSTPTATTSRRSVERRLEGQRRTVARGARREIWER